MSDFIKNTGEIWRCGNLYRTARYSDTGLGSYQDSYILNVCAHPGITQEGLSKLIFVHKSNVARQLGMLEERGFIMRSDDPADKRNTLVYPTDKAFTALEVIRRVYDEWHGLLLEGFTDEERAAAEKYIARMAENARKIIENDERRNDGRK